MRLGAWAVPVEEPGLPKFHLREYVVSFSRVNRLLIGEGGSRDFFARVPDARSGRFRRMAFLVYSSIFSAICMLFGVGLVFKENVSPNAGL